MSVQRPSERLVLSMDTKTRHQDTAKAVPILPPGFAATVPASAMRSLHPQQGAGARSGGLDGLPASRALLLPTQSPES